MNTTNEHKARIFASLFATRRGRGLTSGTDFRNLAARFGTSPAMLNVWECGAAPIPDQFMPTVEAWLASGPVWRFAGRRQVSGPEAWSAPQCR